MIQDTRTSDAAQTRLDNNYILSRIFPSFHPSTYHSYIEISRRLVDRLLSTSFYLIVEESTRACELRMASDHLRP